LLRAALEQSIRENRDLRCNNGVLYRKYDVLRKEANALADVNRTLQRQNTENGELIAMIQAKLARSTGTLAGTENCSNDTHGSRRSPKKAGRGRRGDMLKNLQQEDDRVKKEKRELVNRLAAAEIRIKDLATRLEASQVEKQELQSKNQKLESQTAQLKKAKAKKETKNQELTARLERAKAKKQELQSNNEVLAARLAKAKTKKRELQGLLDRTENSQEEEADQTENGQVEEEDQTENGQGGKDGYIYLD